MTSASTHAPTPADVATLLDLLHAAGEAEDPTGFAEIVTDRIGLLVRSDVSSLNDVDPVAGTVVAVFSPDAFPISATVFEALGRLSVEHPLIKYIHDTGDGSAHKVSDFWDRATWQASELYLSVYRPMGLEHQMSIGFPASRPIVVGLALNRAHTDFSEHDRYLLDLVRPHLAQRWRRARDHARLQVLLDTVSDGLHDDGAAAILLADPIHELTPGAITELYRFFGRPSESGPLPNRVHRWLDHERARTDTQLSHPLAATRGPNQLLLRYLPATARRPDALLLRRSARRDLPSRLSSLGLTRRETEILEHLTAGATNAAIAATLHVSPVTVKHHLESVYRKLGVTGRVQAAAVALTTIAATGKS
jgi:DNA-binding CsgD family transcriptional regulator